MIWAIEVPAVEHDVPLSVEDRKDRLHAAVVKLRFDIDDMTNAEMTAIFADGPVILSLCPSSCLLPALAPNGPLQASN